jgi:hypothetical protein
MKMVESGAGTVACPVVGVGGTGLPPTPMG